MNDNERPQFGQPAKDLSTRPSRARYDKVRTVLELKWRRRELQTGRMMVDVVETLWEYFADEHYAGCGFYLLSEDGASLTAGHHRGIGGGPSPVLGGPRAEAVKSGHAASADVEGRCRVAVPVYDIKGRLWAVLEAVGVKPGGLDEMDKRWLERIVKTFQEVEKFGGGP